MQSKQVIEVVKRALRRLYNESGNERVGFIKGQSVIEVQNVSIKPDLGFEVSGQDIQTFMSDSEYWATWHTHPNQNSNISGKDYELVKNWPRSIHFIIGNDGVRAFHFCLGKKAVLEIA